MSIGLDVYQFQLDSSGVLLNDDTTSSFVDITKISGLDSAPYRETFRDHEGTDGGFADAEFEKGRSVVLEGTVYSSVNEVETYLDDIKANYAPVTAPIPFYFKPDDSVSERVLFVKPLGARYDWEVARRIGATPIQLSMYAEDPRIYDSTLLTTVISYGGDAGLGLAFSFAFSVDFGGGASPGGSNVTNFGNRPTPAEFIIQGPVTNPVIYNNTTGDVMGFTIELGASDTLTINTRDRTVYLNGNINRRNTLTSPGWFFLGVGVTNIGYGGLSGIGSTLTVNFRSAWR